MQFDCLITENNDTEIKFHSGRIWKKLNHSAYDYMDNLGNEYPKNPIQTTELVKAIDSVQGNEKIAFSTDELVMVGLINNEGSKLYLDKKSVSVREGIFKTLAGRPTKYYQRTPNGEVIEVASYNAGGFFEGKVLSEADINFSVREYCTADFYDYVPAIITVGGLVIATYFVATALPIIVSNVKMIQHMWQTYGFQYTYQMYKLMGYNGIISIAQMDMMDGDSSIDDIAERLAAISQKDIDSGKEKLTPQEQIVNKAANYIGKGASKNRGSEVLVLGKYFGETDPNSYQNVAKNVKGSYYSMPQAMWEELNGKYKGNFMWLANQRAIEQQTATAQRVIFTVNPGLYPGTDTYKEYKFLCETLKYPMDLLGGYHTITLL